LALARANVDFGGFFEVGTPDKLAEKSGICGIFMLFFWLRAPEGRAQFKARIAQVMVQSQ